MNLSYEVTVAVDFIHWTESWNESCARDPTTIQHGDSAKQDDFLHRRQH